MISRRDFIGTSLAAGAGLAVTPELLRALQQAGGKLIQRAIPSSGEMLPVISFAPRPTAPPAPGPIPPMPTDVPAAKEVLKIFLANGGKVVDVLHGGPIGEQAARTAASELGIQDKFFWTTPLNVNTPPGAGGPPPKPDAAAVKAHIEEKLARFKVGKIDLVMASAGADPTHFAALRELKKEGRIRYIGAHELLFPANAQNTPYPQMARLEALMRDEQIDFLATDYHAGDRRLEEKILPLALERKIGVMSYFAFDRGRLLKRAGTTPLPAWAAEFDAKTWPQFFLKYVLSQPAVILARTGTTKPEHMLDNIGGGIGRLPDAAMRQRMAALVDTFPPNPSPGPPQPPPGPTVVLTAAVLDRYVGEYKAASGFTAIFRREGDKLMVKPGNNPEAPLIARTETRFQDPRGPFFEFQVDAQGKVTGAVLEQNGPQGVQKMPLERKDQREAMINRREFLGIAAGTGAALALTPALLRAFQQSGGVDWPQWRGPTRDGVVGAALPAQWPEALKKRWEIPVGAGHASPVVSGNRVVVIAREGEQEILRALDLASGKEIWRAAYPAPYIVNPAAQAHGPGPKSTPAIAAGRVFTFGVGGILSAFDLASGTLIWRVPAPGVLPDYGTATSPLIDGTSVIAHVGGNENGALTSFDAATGKPRWQWTGDGPGYGSPIIATFGGVRQVIAQTQKLLVGLDASTGALLWQMPFTTEFDQNAFTPVVFQDLLIYGGIDWPLSAMRLKLVDGKWIGETVWTNPQTPMFMSSPVLIGGTLYGLTMRSRGQFVAIDAASGKTLWNTQGREGENASVLGSRSWLLASTTDGNLVVARANPQKYEEVRRYQIAQSALWSHPAITGNSIIVKDVDKVICWSF